MFGQSPATLVIGTQRIEVRARETVLDAALRAGVAMPWSCRVGACGSCRCRLRAGRVHERSESAYLLEAEEIAAGTILACQSVPVGEVRIEALPGTPTPPAHCIAGRVLAQRRIGTALTELEVQLDRDLPYRAGQHARLVFAALPGEARCYSFARPHAGGARLHFLVSHHHDGCVSGHVRGQDLRGQALTLEGPFGDFRLPQGRAPLLLVAAGSGLAPLLAMLEEALAEGADEAPATLLFGARTSAELYATDRIAELVRRWRGGLRVLPVLSRPEAAWTGARGHVDAHIDPALAADTEACLCGPPAMIAAVRARLQALGLGRERIREDAFEPAGPAAPAAPTAGADATLADYAKYGLFHAIGLFSAAALLAGGWFTTGGLIGVLALYLIGDAVCGEDTRTPRFPHPGLLTLQLWLALPLLALIAFAAVWSASPGDPLGFAAAVQALTGFDLLAARAASGPGHLASAWVLTGLMIGMVGTIPAHELVHRTWDPAPQAIGRWLLAFSFDTAFAIEHVHGHHRHVGTPRDPATAPRGRHVYAHILWSTLHGLRSAWRIECERLRRRGLARWGWRNALLRGWAMSASLLLLAAAIGGWQGALFFVACGLAGKALLEIVNYMEHYGIVRDPSSPVQPRHSWNSNHRISSWTMFNLNRHSHHHAQAETPFQALRPLPRAPTMVAGYLSTIVIALLPPLWRRLMDPKVAAWDREHASEAERRLARG